MLKWTFCSLLKKVYGMKALLQPCITQENNVGKGYY